MLACRRGAFFFHGEIAVETTPLSLRTVTADFLRNVRTRLGAASKQPPHAPCGRCLSAGLQEGACSPRVRALSGMVPPPLGRQRRNDSSRAKTTTSPPQGRKLSRRADDLDPAARHEQHVRSGCFTASVHETPHRPLPVALPPLPARALRRRRLPAQSPLPHPAKNLTVRCCACYVCACAPPACA